MSKETSLSDEDDEVITQKLLSDNVQRTSYTYDAEISGFGGGSTNVKNDAETSSHQHYYVESLDLTRDNPFADPEFAERYAILYERSQYECRHVFDPTLTWSPQEEKALVRKLDWLVCLWACVMFFGLQVDRGNLVQAVSDNLLDDLNLTTNDYNTGHTIFLVSFLLSELPSQLISKKIGPDRWIPLQISLWSVVAISQAALSGKSTFYATRALLGILEGGFIPDVILWLSYFYTSRELPIRLSIFWTSLSLTTIVTSLLAFIILHMRGVQGWSGWRWLFLIEGLITFLVGLASFFKMPASAVETKAWFRPKGWFNDREVRIVVNRVLRDDPSKGDMHNRQAITLHGLWNAASDFDLWPIYILGLVVFTPMVPVNSYITLTLKDVGFSTVGSTILLRIFKFLFVPGMTNEMDTQFATNVLTIPFSVGHIIGLLSLTRLSEWRNERTFTSMIQSIWVFPCILALRFWPDSMTNAWGTYAILMIMLSYPYCHAILVAWTSKNSNNVGTRTVSAAIYNMCVQLGNIIGNNVYRTDDRPKYRRGNSILLALNILGIALFLSTKTYYVFRNKQRDRKWASMSNEISGISVLFAGIEYVKFQNLKSVVQSMSLPSMLILVPGSITQLAHSVVSFMLYVTFKIGSNNPDVLILKPGMLP